VLAEEVGLVTRSDAITKRVLALAKGTHAAAFEQVAGVEVAGGCRPGV
jgi:hypothetical protein